PPTMDEEVPPTPTTTEYNYPVMDDHVAEGIIPPDASTIGDVNPQAGTSGSDPIRVEDIGEGVMEGQGGDEERVGRGGRDKKTPSSKQDLPPPLVKVKSRVLPLKIADEPEGVIQKTPAKDRLVEELKKLQTHDPDVIPMQGGGYGKIIKNEQGQLVAIQPIEQPMGVSTTQIEQLVSETTLEYLNLNTLGLLRRVALNPAVTMGHTYVTNTIDEATGAPLFTGDLADWINHCVEQWLKYAFGVKFGIFTGMPSLKDLIPRGENN
ncbi:MAG: hypothetical protein NTY03_03095, partial [Candidatus Bathyarchaeota archaeon]|nr:hypothetical protein [Candidatus Bathyarchaeota archaeon]